MINEEEEEEEEENMINSGGADIGGEDAASERGILVGGVNGKYRSGIVFI